MEEIPEKYLDKPSQLLLKLGAHKKGGDSDELKNTYDTESDVSGYISAALEDAVFLVESSIDRKLYVHHEFSLFSDRPDHLVVFDKETNDPILAVEDKKPWDAKEEITKPVLGLKYLTTSWNCGVWGIPPPLLFCLLSSTPGCFGKRMSIPMSW